MTPTDSKSVETIEVNRTTSTETDEITETESTSNQATYNQPWPEVPVQPEAVKDELPPILGQAVKYWNANTQSQYDAEVVKVCGAGRFDLMVLLTPPGQTPIGKSGVSMVPFVKKGDSTPAESFCHYAR